jgi:hypothetical protein
MKIVAFDEIYNFVVQSFSIEVILIVKVFPAAAPHGARCIVLQFFCGPYIFAKKRKEKCKKKRKNSKACDNKVKMIAAVCL